MYYRILQMLAGLFIFCAACRQAPKNTTNHKLLDSGPQATQLLTQDTIEGYFERVMAHDIQLQMGGEVSDSLLILDQYLDWLPKQVMDWPPALRKRGNDLLTSCIADVEKQFPHLLPENIALVILNNEPFGPHIYFTRNNAIFVPVEEMKNATDRVLKNILTHELFHLVSRDFRNKREALYAIANFIPASTELSLDSLNVKPLCNPDAPNTDYWLSTNGEFYVPLLYAVGKGSSFEDVLNYGVHKVAMSETTEGAAYATDRTLWQHQVMQAAEANTNYIIHPEEILADHFALLINGETDQLLHASELEELRSVLEGFVR